MALIEWQEYFELGILDVDQEHRELIELINRIHRRLKAGDAGNPVSAILGDIHAQIAAHFALEERIMRQRNYRHYADHKEDHEVLLDDIRDIMDRYEDDRSYDPAAFGAELTRWFTEHFSSHDALLHSELPGA